MQDWGCNCVNIFKCFCSNSGMLPWLQSLESQLAQERIEVDHLQELLGAAKEKADRDKEALKKATRWGYSHSVAELSRTNSVWPFVMDSSHKDYHKLTMRETL